MSEDYISSSDPLAHSESSEQLNEGSYLFTSAMLVKGKKANKRSSPHHGQKNIEDDDDTSSANLTSSIKMSLRKRRSEWEKAAASNDQELIDYHEINEKNISSPILNEEKNDDVKEKNNKKTNVKEIHNNHKNDAAKVNKPVQSRCCLLI